MTKYILHGGIKEDGEYKKDFFDEMVLSLPQKKLTVLYVPFGESEEKKQKNTEIKQKQFDSFLTQKTTTVVKAEEDIEKFLDQTHNADIVYFGGGNTKSMIDFLKKIPLDILIQHLNNKVIVGVSAGANSLSKYYFSLHRQRIEEGLGIIPIKTICHYTLEKEPQLEELENYKEHLTSFALPEDYFVIIS
ncbi:MAG TPA: Type 1 glutamine amidotransferase-like domain-containing protein [Patescibacteria group bacterium]